MNSKDFLNQTNLDTVISILRNDKLLEQHKSETKYQNYLLSYTNLNLALDTINKYQLRLKNLGSDRAIYQNILKQIILNTEYLFIKSVLKGPKHLINQLTLNEAQCFKNAGLLDDNPPMDVVNWWDSIKLSIRDKEDSKKLEIGRNAEKKSFEYEKERLSKYNLDDKVIWVSIYDDLLGYDIESSDEKGNKIFIEVKKSSVQERRFYFTRNEWNKAQGKKNSYFIHLWDFKDQLKIIEYPEICNLVLENTKTTTWENLEIII